MTVSPFQDRTAAGTALAQALAPLVGRPDLLVLGMARGGVLVAREVARLLSAPLEVFVARKLGVPGVEEVAFGAIAEGHDVPVFDTMSRFIGIPASVARTVAAREREELMRRVRCYRGARSFPDVAGRTVVVVDDGLSSGATLRAAGLALRRRHPARLIAAVPVASASGIADVATVFDDAIAVATPEPFGMVSDWYEYFEQVTDADLLAVLGQPAPDEGPPVVPFPDERSATIPVRWQGGSGYLAADLGMPDAIRQSKGLVIFAHGGGSSRQSYRNRYLAARLRLAGWATLRVDLLLDDEVEVDDATAKLRFDIPLITGRLRGAVDWCRGESVAGHERIVLFGASTGSAAALGVAADMPDSVWAVMSRSGRVDLTPSDLARVRVPALLIVGGADRDTVRLNVQAIERLGGPVALRVVRGAGHVFEEPGALGRVGELAARWLGRQERRARLRGGLRSLFGRSATGSAPAAT